MKNFLWQLLIYQLLIQGYQAERNFRVMTTYVNCRLYDPEYLENATCILDRRNGSNYLNAIFRLRKSVAKFDIHWILEFIVPKRPKFTLINLHLDGCALFGQGNPNKLMQISMRNIRKYINTQLVCPLKANFSYILKDYTYNASDLPSYVPESKFKFSATFSRSGKNAFKFISAGELTHKVYNMSDSNGGSIA